MLEVLREERLGSRKKERDRKIGIVTVNVFIQEWLAFKLEILVIDVAWFDPSSSRVIQKKSNPCIIQSAQHHNCILADS